MCQSAVHQLQAVPGAAKTGPRPPAMPTLLLLLRMLLPIHAMPLLHCSEVLFLLLQVSFLVHAGGIVVQDDEVAVLHIEATEVVCSLFGIINVLIHNIRRTTGLFAGASVTGKQFATKRKQQDLATSTGEWTSQVDVSSEL